MINDNVTQEASYSVYFQDMVEFLIEGKKTVYDVSGNQIPHKIQKMRFWLIMFTVFSF